MRGWDQPQEFGARNDERSSYCRFSFPEACGKALTSGRRLRPMNSSFRSPSIVTLAPTAKAEEWLAGASVRLRFGLAPLLLEPHLHFAVLGKVADEFLS
jgi:hypothetical protein